MSMVVKLINFDSGYQELYLKGGYQELYLNSEQKWQGDDGIGVQD